MLGYIVAASLGYIGLEACLKFGKKPDSDIKNLNQFFQTVGFCSKGDEPEYAHVEWVENHDFYKIFGIKIPVGHDVNSLFKLKYALENLFKNDVEILHSNQNYRIKVFKKRLGTLKDYPFEVVKVPDTSHLYITPAVSLSGYITINLSETLPHILIAGSSGSGKSVMVKSIICQLFENYEPHEFNLFYMDNKGGLEGGFFKNTKYFKKGSKNAKETIDILFELREEMFKRMELFERKGVASIIHYNKKVSKEKRLPFILAVIDELFSFMTLPKSSTKPEEIYTQNIAYNLMGEITSMCRAAGIHLMFCTQRPTSDVIPTFITCNCGIRIGLKTTNEQESRNIIETNGLELIEIDAKGSGIVKMGELIKFQAFYLTDDKVLEICSKHCKPSTGTIKTPILKESEQQEDAQEEKTKEIKKENNDLDWRSISRGV